MVAKEPPQAEGLKVFNFPGLTSHWSVDNVYVWIGAIFLSTSMFTTGWWATRRSISSLERIKQKYGHLLVDSRLTPIFTGSMQDQIINLMTVHERLKRCKEPLQDDEQRILKDITPLRNEAVHEWTLLIRAPCANDNQWLQDLHRLEIARKYRK